MSDDTGKTTIMEQLDVEGLLIHELAALLDVSEATINYWITKKTISPESMEALCDLFDLDECEWDLTVTRNSGAKGKTWTKTVTSRTSWEVSEDGKERIRRGIRIYHERVHQNS